MQAATPAVLSVGDARQSSVWLDRARPQQLTSSLSHDLSGHTSVDLLIVGGGLTGLWAAIEASLDGREVLLVDSHEVGGGASGRCGGFMNPSITHGISNGHSRWPESMPEIIEIQRALWEDTVKFVSEHDGAGIIEPVGKLTVWTKEHQRADAAASAELLARYGEDHSLFDRDQVRSLVDSPTYLGGLLHTSANGLCDPVRLSWVLAQAAATLGAVVAEHTHISGIDDNGDVVKATTTVGATISARQVLLATNAYPPLRRRIRARVIPVYDHVIATAPLNESFWDQVGWKGFGITDAGNQFHYYRPTPDGRILFGGWDATYHFGGKVDLRYEQQQSTHEVLVNHLVETFPQLEDVEITHKWGGPIDSTSRFTPMFDTAMGDKLGWAVGFTGLGVGASRFGARTALELLSGTSTPRTRLPMVRKQPIPFPPEPLRWATIQFTKRALHSEDELGRRGLWLSLLRRFGIGFDT